MSVSTKAGLRTMFEQYFEMSARALGAQQETQHSGLAGFCFLRYCTVCDVCRRQIYNGSKVVFCFMHATLYHEHHYADLFTCILQTRWRILKAYVRLQNLPWYKTSLVSRQVLHILSKLQNWFCPKTGQYKTCLVSNTKIEASIRATKPKPWQSHLTSETVEIFFFKIKRQV